MYIDVCICVYMCVCVCVYLTWMDFEVIMSEIS